MKLCKFWSRKAMNVVDTALESLDTHDTRKTLKFNVIFALKQIISNYKWNITATCGTPVVSKILKTINMKYDLSNAVSTTFIAFLDQKLHSFKHTKASLFVLKLRKKLGTSQQCTSALRYSNFTCDTSFESSDIILFITNNFGNHSNTHGTQNSLNPQMTLQKRLWYPNGTHFFKSTMYEIFNVMSTVSVAFLDQNF